MKQIPVGRGKFALVDDEDFERLSQFKWMCYRARSKNTKCWHVRLSKWGKQTYMHRMIVFPPAGMIVDHIDRDGLNNQKSNLRFCTHWQNSMNASPRLGTSKYKGVCFRKDSRKWRARIRVHGKLIQLGNFDNEEDAARCYDEAAKKYFGEFAYLNNVNA